MIYLFSQIAISLALAAIVGGALGWIAHRFRSGKKILELQQIISRQQQQVSDAKTEVNILSDDFNDLKERSESRIRMLSEENQTIPDLNQNLEKSQLLVRQLMEQHKTELDESNDEKAQLLVRSRQVDDLEFEITKLQTKLEIAQRNAERLDTRTADNSAQHTSKNTANLPETGSDHSVDLINSKSVSQFNTPGAQAETASVNAPPADSAQTSAIFSDSAAANSAPAETVRTNSVNTDTAPGNAVTSNTAHTNTAHTNTTPADTGPSNTTISDTTPADTVTANIHTDTAATNTGVGHRTTSGSTQFDNKQPSDSSEGITFTTGATKLPLSGRSIDTNSQRDQITNETPIYSNDDTLPNAAQTKVELQELRDQLANDTPAINHNSDTNRFEESRVGPGFSRPHKLNETQVDDTKLEQMFDTVDQHDDLKQIFGIGPLTEKTLNKLGITAYSQLAELKQHDIEKIADALQIFPGRIERDNWVGSARLQLEEVLEDL